MNPLPVASFFFWGGAALRIEMDEEDRIIEVCDALTAIGAACDGIIFGENVCKEIAILERNGWHLSFEINPDGFAITGRPPDGS